MRKILILLLLIAGQRVLWAQNHEHTLLWRISGNGLAKNSYLFGTIHAICSDDFFFSEAAEKALSESEQLALELDMDDPMMLLQVQQSMLMPNGGHLKKLLSETDYERLNRFFKDSVKMDLNMLGMMKPMALAALVYPRLLSCQTISYEMKLMEMAKKQKKEVIGIETVTDQLKVFDAIPLESQAKMLLEMLDKYGEQANEMQALMATYKKQDINALYENIKKSSFGAEQFEEVLLTNRNRAWIDKITRLSNEKAVFYALGAGHLGGPNGVIALLRSKGFTIEPVK
jgi:uncharacterized protein YbaP (TraB family)